MALREFTDQQATPWRAWDVRPTGARRPGALLPTAPGLESGWICFESAGEKRRLAPIPEGWEVWSEERLRASLAEARAAGRPTPASDGLESAPPVVAAPDREAYLAALDLVPDVEPDPEDRL